MLGDSKATVGNDWSGGGGGEPSVRALVSVIVSGGPLEQEL